MPEQPTLWTQSKYIGKILCLLSFIFGCYFLDELNNLEEATDAANNQTSKSNHHVVN